MPDASLAPTLADPSAIRPRTGSFATLVGSFFLVALFFSAQNVVVRVSRGAAIDWQWDVFHELIYWLTWAGFAPVILAWTRRHRFERGRAAETVARHLALMLVIGPLQILASYGNHLLIGRPLGFVTPDEAAHWFALRKSGIVWGTFAGYLYYWIIVGIALAFSYRAEAARLEDQVAQAQLDTLRSQLEPHFLFNTLNAIGVLIGEAPAQAQRMLLHLSDLLRATLERRGFQEVSLTDELALLDRYLAIQRMRHADRVRVELAVAPGLHRALIPTLLLQPIVENAFRHGLDRNPAGGTISIRANQLDDHLRLEVEDTGPGGLLETGTEPRGEGIGFANTRARLARLYPRRHAFEFRPQPDGGAVVMIDIPYRTGAS